MDYKQLLDPKGFAKEKSRKPMPNHGPQQPRKATNSGPNMSHPTLTKFDPKALLNPKGAVGGSKVNPSNNSETASVNGDASPAMMESTNVDGQTGMGSIIERMHGATNRESPLQKKRKLEPNGDEDDEQREKTNSTFNSGRGGVLGDYLRDEREKGAAESGPSNTIVHIDLTEPDEPAKEDEDEIIFVGENSKEDSKEVCGGRLTGKGVVHQIPNAPRYQTGSSMGNDHWPQIRVNIRRTPGNHNLIDLFARSSSQGNIGTKFGTMDAKVASALCPLLDSGAATKMRLKVYLEAFLKRPGEFPGSRTSRGLDLSIMVYAPRNKMDAIGKLLSQKGLFLSQPYQVEPGIAIYNPHVPQILGASKPGLRRPQASQQIYGVARTQEEMIRETTNMFDSLIKAEELPEMEADSTLILTPLMTHQKKALHFLTEHERNDRELEDTSSFSLWKPRDKNNGRAWYNVITNHEVTHKPAPAQGGILADVMGLGKTLSILALIADTMDNARHFGELEAAIELETITRNSKGTLIICPKSVSSNWQEQVKAHTHRNRFNIYLYHGTNRTQDVDELASYDIVIAPYQTVASEFSNAQNKRTALASINWFRVVLDEAHQIRNPGTHVSKACCALSAQRRWAVTGTPVQNRLDDLGALIRFLKIKPFDDDKSWAQHIIAPFRNADPNVVGQLRLLVDSITLRRMKDNIGLTDRHEKRVRLDFSDDEMLIYSQFAKQANTKYRIMTKEHGRLRGKSFAHVLKSLGRLRAICAHGQEMLNEDDMKELEGLTAGTAIDLGDEPDDEPDGTFIGERSAYDTLKMMCDSEVDICISCSRKIGDKREGLETETPEDSEADDEYEDSSELDSAGDTMGFLTPCFHLLCPRCKDEYVETAVPRLTEDHYLNCSYCDQYVRFGLFEFRRSTLTRLLDSRAKANKKGGKAKWDESTYSGPHTKVKALLEDLKISEEETAKLSPNEPPIRSVVFSGWTSYLDLIEHALEEHNIGFVRLDGSMSVKARSAVLKTFAADPTVTVLLVSIKAGGQGLNFTVANKAYMMEPQFNPGVEQQAIDRLHRLGQKRDVQIIHYIMRDSVEEKILKLQEKKEKLAQLSMEKKMSRAEEAKQRIEELRDLFK